MNTERDNPEQLPSRADLMQPAAGTRRSSPGDPDATGAGSLLDQFIATTSLRIGQHRLAPIQADLLVLFARGYSYSRLCQYAQIHDIKVDRSEMRRYIQAVITKSKSNIERAALLESIKPKELSAQPTATTPHYPNTIQIAAAQTNSNTPLPSSHLHSESLRKSPSPAPSGQAREITPLDQRQERQIPSSAQQAAHQDENQRERDLPGNAIVPKVKLSGFIKDPPKVTIEPNKGSGKP